MSDIEIFTEDNIGWIALNRPEARNALTPEMLEQWAGAYRAFDADPAVRVVVLTGRGEAFCAGADVKLLATKERSPLSDRQMLTELVHPVTLAAESLSKPLIAAVTGDAVGAGMDVALAADYRIAAEHARLSQGYIRVGLVPGDGATHYLPRIAGRSRALRMMWTGEFISASTALAWNIVDEVHPRDQLDSAVATFARAIAAQPPIAVQLIKNAVRAGETTDIRTSLDLIASHQAVVMATADSAEAMTAFRERRAGNYTGR